MPVLEHARETLRKRLNELLVLIVDLKDRNPIQRSKTFVSDMNLQGERVFSEEREVCHIANKKRKIQ